jgi:fatty-acyl-CoA synthase/long-chain acyl-CoA synthetase
VAAPDYLALHANRMPDRVALIDDRAGGPVTKLTWAEFNSRVNRLAHALCDRGIRAGDKVVWCGANSIGVVCLVHAARKIGATAVPLNYRFSPEEAAYVVDHCDAGVVYVDADFAPLILEARDRTPKVRDVLVFDGTAGPGAVDADALLASASDAEPTRDDGAEDAATMTYTSGTTGQPKGALRRGLGDRTQVRSMLELIGYQSDDVFLTTGPLYHSGPGGFMQISQGLGHTVVIQRRFDPVDWLRLVEAHGVTTTFSAPTPIRMVCHLDAEVKDRFDRSSMRRMIANAAPWSYALKQAYLADFPDDSLWEVYGSTELGVNTILAPEDQRRKPGSCGKAAPTVDLALFDDDGKQITQPRVPGELFVRSKTVFDTYYKAHDRYEEDRRGDYHTVGDVAYFDEEDFYYICDRKDVAYFDEEGFYFICDRKKDMIISGGMNIYPAEIEAALEHHSEIRDVAVFGIPSEEWGESVHAVVVLQPGAVLDEEAVIAFAREHLASYKIPRSVSFVSEIPRTGSGKILKRVLREPYWKDHATGVL